MMPHNYIYNWICSPTNHRLLYNCFILGYRNTYSAMIFFPSLFRVPAYSLPSTAPFHPSMACPSFRRHFVRSTGQSPSTLPSQLDWEIDGFVKLYRKSLNERLKPKFPCRGLMATPYSEEDMVLSFSYMDGGLLCYCQSCQLGYWVKAYNIYVSFSWAAKGDDRVFAEPFDHPDDLMQAFDLSEMPVQLAFRQHLGLNRDKCCNSILIGQSQVETTLFVTTV